MCVCARWIWAHSHIQINLFASTIVAFCTGDDIGSGQSICFHRTTATVQAELKLRNRLALVHSPVWHEFDGIVCFHRCTSDFPPLNFARSSWHPLCRVQHVRMYPRVNARARAQSHNYTLPFNPRRIQSEELVVIFCVVDVRTQENEPLSKRTSQSNNALMWVYSILCTHTMIIERWNLPNCGRLGFWKQRRWSEKKRQTANVNNWCFY